MVTECLPLDFDKASRNSSARPGADHALCVHDELSNIRLPDDDAATSFQGAFLRRIVIIWEPRCR